MYEYKESILTRSDEDDRGTFLGLNQVRRVAGESDEDREVRLQALRTKKVLDPGSVPLELVVSVLVTVVSLTLTCFSSSQGLTQVEEMQ